ncbi:hypothetical protein ATSB10_27710 [Dyella thiooxydans]|uniref:SGNH hydrolase-type esterase domain-containing protein n=2 Tax=Dyella thiooxydans TaxID=445710 RepID=A0A169GVZ7_9GAMM|nr:hypothetical protein ATSB10_27710 [Dyella thiooxydans]
MTETNSSSRRRATLAILFGIALSSGMAHAHDAGSWHTVWAAAMVRSPVPASDVRPTAMTAPRLQRQTLRQMVLLSAGGSRTRIRISNTFGTHPLHIDAASVGRSAAADVTGRLDPASLHALRFSGHVDLVIPAGAVRYSDPLDFPVRSGESLGISIYVGGTAVPSTWHVDALRTNLISAPGDYTGKAAMPVATTTGATLWLSGVEVQAKAPLPVLVALGDSITNGFRSTLGASQGYPEQLARRLRARGEACHVAVVNAGIDGNEISDRDGGYGPGEGMATRFDRDVLGQQGVRFVLLLGGVNDIGETTMALRSQGKTLDGQAVATNVIAAEQQIIGRAHAAGLRIFGATILPFEGTRGAYSSAGERARKQVNDWILHRADFDGVVDFDAALRDPSHPARMRPDLDSGDHIHPNDKGYASMAAAVPAIWLGCPP